MDQKNTAITRILPTLCHGVARIFLTAPRSYDAVALHRGPCEQLLRYGKLATSCHLSTYLGRSGMSPLITVRSCERGYAGKGGSADGLV
jgi:hypothetical protein